MSRYYLKDKELVEYFDNNGNYQVKLVTIGSELGKERFSRIISRFKIGQNKHLCEQFKIGPIKWKNFVLFPRIDFPYNHCLIPQYDKFTKGLIEICVNCGLAYKDKQMIKI